MSVVALEDEPSPEAEERPGLRLMTSRRVAIILFNLGGPDSQSAVRPFLFNLFNDKAIIGAPQPLRYLIAQLISRTRAKLAKANYALIGGGSPILPETDETSRCAGGRDRQARQQRDLQMLPGDALLAAAREARGEGGGGLGRDRRDPAAALSAVLLHHDRAHRWQPGERASEAALLHDLLLSRRRRLRAGACRRNPEGLARRRLAGEPARAVLRARPAAERRSIAAIPISGKSSKASPPCASCCRRTGQTRICYQSRVGPLKWLGAVDRAGNPRRGARTGSASSFRRSPSSPSTSRRWSSSTSSTAHWPSG